MLQGQPVGDVEAGPGMPYIEDGTEEEEQEEEEEEEAGDAEAGPAMPYFEDGTEEEEEEGDIEAGPAMPYFEEEEEAAAAGEEEEEGEAEGEEGEGEDAAAAEEKEEEAEEEREEEAAAAEEEEEAVIKTGLRIAIPVSLTAAAGIIAVLTGFVGNKNTSTTPNFLFKASFTSMCATFLFGLFLILLAMLRSSIPCRLIAIVRSLALAAMVSLALVVGFGAAFYFLRDG